MTHFLFDYFFPNSFVFFNLLLFTVVSPLSPSLSPTLSSPIPTANLPIIHAHESSVCVALLDPSPSFPSYHPPPPQGNCQFVLFFFFLRFYWFIFREGEGREKERNIKVWLPLVHPLLGTWPTTQACALNRNWTRDPFVHRLALNSLSHTSQGISLFFISKSLVLFGSFVCFVH